MSAASTVGARAARGAMWNVGASVAARVLGLVGTLYMTRLLNPDVIGEVSAAYVLAATATWLSHWGFNQYMMTKAQGSPERTYHVAVINAGFGVIGITAIAFTGSLFAPLLSAPNLALYLPGLALSVLIRRLAGVADKVLARDLRFREIAIANAAGEITFTASALTLASMTHLGGQAIVVANILQAIVNLALVMRATGMGWFQRSPWNWNEAREIIRWGFPLGVAQVLSSASRYWDNLAFSHFFGRQVLGLYNMAYNLADVPAVQFGEQIAGVLLPAMQKVDESSRKRALVTASALLALIVFPMAIGLGAVAQSLVALLLRAEWQGVAPLLTVLCALSVFRPLTWTFATYLNAYGRNRLLMLFEALKLTLLIGCIAAFSKLGPLWSAGAVGLAFAIHAMVLVLFVSRTDKIPLSELAGGFIRPLMACACMTGAVLLVRHGLRVHGFHSPLLFIALEIVVGAAVYVPAAFLFAPETSRDLLGRLRKALRRGG